MYIVGKYEQPRSSIVDVVHGHLDGMQEGCRGDRVVEGQLRIQNESTIAYTVTLLYCGQELRTEQAYLGRWVGSVRKPAAREQVSALSLHNLYG